MKDKQDVKSVKDKIIADQKAEIRELKSRNDFLQRMVNGLKLNNSALTLERNQLVDELQTIKGMSMFEFGNTYCSSESLEADGHAFARALGVGVRMTEAEVAIDEAENAYVPYSGDDF